MQNALSDRSNTVQWQHPDHPILCSFKDRKFNYSKGAKTQQLLETLNEAAQLSGIGKSLVTHDIRRGSAADAANLRPTRNIDNAALALGHRPSTTYRGTTVKYVRHNNKSKLAGRVQVEPTDNFGLQPVDVRAVDANEKKRKVSLTDIDEYLQRPENAHLTRLKTPRHAAGRAINKIRSQEAADRLRSIHAASRQSALLFPLPLPPAPKSFKNGSYSTKVIWYHDWTRSERVCRSQDIQRGV